MKKDVINIVIIYIVLFSFLMPMVGQTTEIPQLNSHVHGLSELTIALEKQTLEIELRSPAMNIVGFEHKIQTEQENKIVKRAIKLLNAHHDLFSLSGGDCILEDQLADVSSINDANLLPEEYQGHHKHHSEVVANYRYRCEKASRLSAITVNVFDYFGGIRHIDTKWLTDTQQSSVILSPTNQVITLR